MNKIDWGAPVSPEEAARRAGGRAHYNSMRQFQASERRLKVAKMLRAGQRKAGIARVLGVNAGTITRDVQDMLAWARAMGECPLCGGEMQRQTFGDDAEGGNDDAYV